MKDLSHFFVFGVLLLSTNSCAEVEEVVENNKTDGSFLRKEFSLSLVVGSTTGDKK